MDFLTGGTASMDAVHGSFPASQGADNNDATRCSTPAGAGFGTAFPHWWKYDLGAGVTKTATRMRMKAADVSGGGGDIGLKNFQLQGSNDDSAWTTITTQQQQQNENYQEYTFTNTTPYRYYRIYATDQWQGTYQYLSFWELELFESPKGAMLNLI